MVCSFADAEDAAEPAVFLFMAEEMKADGYYETQLTIK
jgi:hypothetical protein